MGRLGSWLRKLRMAAIAEELLWNFLVILKPRNR
jgi:hypothetical protein